MESVGVTVGVNARNGTDLPEGLRMRKMREAYEKVLNKILNSITEKRFLECFPEELLELGFPLINSTERTPKKRKETEEPLIAVTNLSSYSKEFKKQISDTLKQEFDQICQRRNLCERLNLLDELIENQLGQLGEVELDLNDKNLQLDYPELSVESPIVAMCKRRIRVKLDEKERLESILSQVREEEKKLFSTISELQVEQEIMEQERKDLVEPLEKAFKISQDWITDESNLA